MKKQFLAVLLTLAMLLSVLPVSALAAEGDEDSAPVCAGLEDCTEDAHDKECPLYTAPAEEGDSNSYYEFEDVYGIDEDTAVISPIQERIDALPGAEALSEMDTEEQAEVYAEVCAIYDAIDELTDEEAGALDMSALEEAAVFFTRQIMPLDGETTGEMSGDCSAEGSNVKWELTENDDGYTLTISGEGAMADYALSYNTESKYYYAATPWHTQLTVDSDTYLYPITELKIGEGITYIGNSAFVGLNISATPDFPSALEGMGSYVFEGCINIESVDWDNYPLTYIPEGFLDMYNRDKTDVSFGGALTLPDKITSIGIAAFRNTNVSGALVLGHNVTTVGAHGFRLTDITSVSFQNPDCKTNTMAFQNCTKLTSASLPENLEAVSKQMFQGCSALTNITIPDNVTSIEESAFDSCTALTSAVLSKNLTMIGSWAFRNSGLEEITIPDSVTSIGNSAFYGCGSLTSAILSEELTEISQYAFYSCGLGEVTIPSSVTTIGSNAFGQCKKLSKIYLNSNQVTGWENSQSSFAGVGADVSGGTTMILGEQVTIIPAYLCNHWSDSRNTDIKHLVINGILSEVGTGSVDSTKIAAVYIQTAGCQSKIRAVNDQWNNNDYVKYAYAVTNEGTFANDATFETDALTTPVKDGYTFDGWYYTSNGSETKVDDNTTLQSKTIYTAKWNSKITFDANGGTSTTGMEPQTIAETDTSTKLTKNTYTRDSYEFSGWNTAADGSGTSYTDEATGAGANGNITLYAQWTKKIGESTNYTVNAIVDQTYTGEAIEPAVVVKSGDTVLDSGYTVTYSDNTNVGTAKVTVAIGADKAEVEFKIVKDEKPTIEMADVSVTYGTEYTMTATAKTSAGNEITGGTITIKYYTEEDCTGDGTDTAPTNAGTYYAKATLTGTTNYAEKFTVATITIRNSTFSVKATGYDGTYDGTAHSITVEADGADVTYCETENGTYSSTNPTYTNAGEYTVYYKATKANHDDVTGSATVKIAKVQTSLTLTADPTSMSGAGTVKLTVSSTGIPEAAAISAPTCEGVTVTANSDGTYSVSLPNETKDYTFTVSYAGDDNHEVATATCTVSVTRRSSGGGGSSSGSSSSSNTTTETVTNKDGSTTTTVTDKKTGTVTETTKYKDGSTLVVETKKDGTVTTTETAANGVKVKTVDDPGENVTAAVTIPRSVGTTTVTIPADTTPGTVAVDAKTGEIVKLSVPTEDGMTVKLDGSANLVLEDRSKNFTDTRNHWAEDAIDFATAHEMFSGTSDTTFTPDSPMTRAMLMTVLARFDGEDTAGGSVWYEKGMAWAVANGVSDGSNPNGSITREQFATMLWRYAGSPAVSGSLTSFSDRTSVSGYATDAMRWAVSTGIIGGMGNGTLAPQGNATRAQVATMLMRFVENLTK